MTNPSREAACLGCGKSLTLFIGEPARANGFSLGSLMFLIAVISLGLALTRIEPFLGVTSLVICVPAMIRTIRIAERERAWSTPMHILDMLGLFFGSVFIIVLVVAATLICFGFLFSMGQWGTGNSTRSWSLAMVFAGIPSTALAIWLSHVLTRQYKR